MLKPGKRNTQLNQLLNDEFFLYRAALVVSSGPTCPRLLSSACLLVFTSLAVVAGLFSGVKEVSYMNKFCQLETLLKHPVANDQLATGFFFLFSLSEPSQRKRGGVLMQHTSSAAFQSTGVWTNFFFFLLLPASRLSCLSLIEL